MHSGYERSSKEIGVDAVIITGHGCQPCAEEMMKRSFIEHAVRGGLLASILAAAGCSGRVNIGDDSRGLGDEVSGSGGFGSTAHGGPLGHSGGSAGRSG